MAARVFKLDELATCIATCLFAISRKSTVALALTCKALEVPALRVVWERQSSLKHLIKHILSMDARCYIFPRDSEFCLLALQRPLTTGELNRLKRYASWMRRLDVREWGLSREITQLVVPTPAGTSSTLPLHIRELDWWLNETNLSFLPGFLSPHLTNVIITTNTFPHPNEAVDIWDEELPDEVVPKMRSAIKMLPSSLQSLEIQLGGVPETRLTEEISAFVLGCGESLREFSTNLVLSTQAIVHLMKLPNLCVFVTEQAPPQVTELIHNGVPDGVVSLFPALDILDIRSEAALEWLPLFEAKNDSTPPWIMASGSLPMVIYRHPTLSVDSPLISRLLPLADLTRVLFDMECLWRPCASKLTDQDMERLAIALPKLESLTLCGWPCSSDTCPTTVRSLLSLSIHCTKLKQLSIHFRTASLRADMLGLLAYAYSQDLHSRPKCALEALVTGEMSPQLADHDHTLISIGILMIFPSLARFVSSSPVWAKTEVTVRALGQIGGSLAVMTENFMRVLDQIENRVPLPSADEITRIICELLSLIQGAD